MKSSSSKKTPSRATQPELAEPPEAAPSPAPAPPYAPVRGAELWVCLLLILLSIAGVGVVHPKLVRQHAALKAKTDVYALPSPEQTVVASLGYRSALADLIYANVLVSYGQHIQERRGFDYIADYLDTIAALDPKFAEPYRYADTFIILQAKEATREDYFRARKVFERGMRELPNDASLWITAGQYIAYFAPPHLGDDKLFAQWRLDGARILARACELVSSNEALPYQCITAASLFSSAGEEAATERFLERVIAVSDDPELRKLALGYVEAKLSQAAQRRIQRRFTRLADARSAELPFVSKDRYLVLGPAFDAAALAGHCDGAAPPASVSTGKESVACTTDWPSWVAEQERLERLSDR